MSEPIVYMMLGLPGSGKTTFSKSLQGELKLKRLAIDEEYSKLGGNLKDPHWNKKIAEEAGTLIKQQTKDLVSNGESVILDLCPWVKDKRSEYRRYIESIGARCHIYYFKVDKSELLKRLAIRNDSGLDFYVISPEMLNDFIEEFDEPLNEEVEEIDS